MWYSAPTMHVEEIKTKSKDKTYSCYLLREARREGQKTIKTTVANISHLPLNEIEAIRQALRYKEAGVRPSEVGLKGGKIVGALHVVNELLQRAGIMAALGKERQAALCAWLVFARLMEQGSRLSSVRLAKRHEISILGLKSFDEDDLYEALDWLAKRQRDIEETLFKQRYGTQTPQLFLYDVTSSYLEGMENELGWWGYNRDGKTGKQQIVFGMLTDAEGEPIAVEVFAGNTQDQSTFIKLIKNFAKRFKVAKVTFVGDRGMIKSVGIEELHKHEFFYITAITKPQIRKLLKDGVIQLGLFDESVQEVVCSGIRYILERHPKRAAEQHATRMEKLKTLKEKAESEEEYLNAHTHASIAKTQDRLQAIAKRLVIDTLVKVCIEEGKGSVEVLEDKWAQAKELDGCYVLKTDLPAAVISKETVHQRYKDLAKVERGFRTMKTGLLEVRPIWLRKEQRTRAHVFVCMLAYLITREIEKVLADDETLKDVVEQLKTISVVEMVFPDNKVPTIPEPPPEVRSIFNRLKIALPMATRFVVSKKLFSKTV